VLESTYRIWLVFTDVASSVARASILAVQSKFHVDYCRVSTSAARWRKAGKGSLSEPQSTTIHHEVMQTYESRNRVVYGEYINLRADRRDTLLPVDMFSRLRETVNVGI
jgi:hypothetical protein